MNLSNENTTFNINKVNTTTLLPSDEETLCYLCLDTGVDEAGRLPRRNCACRGTDAGFVHLSCLAGFAASKSVRWDGRSMNEFIKPWEICPNCHQDYQNELGIDIATEFYSFVRRQYPDDTRMQVEALHLKLGAALMGMAGRLQPVKKREAGVIADVLLSLIDRMKKEVSPLPKHYSQFEAYTHGVHGGIALYEGTDESARRAVVHFESELKVYEAIGDVDGVTSAKSNIAIAKSMYEGGRNTEQGLRASREVYKMCVTEYGEGNASTIRAGRIYAFQLKKANRGDEAIDLLTKLLATSKQVLGPHHNITKDVESTLQGVVLKLKL